MEHKYKDFQVKSEGVKDSGTISGYFSTYDRIPDSYGDVIAPGAFTDTIKAREESGHPFPLCWNHDLNQIIGKVDSIEDTEKGPLMTASFFDTPLAQEKRQIVQSGVVYQFSFAYDVEDAEQVELEDGTKANELRKLTLYEVSIVPNPANQNAVMTDVKAEEQGKSKKHEIKVDIIPMIGEKTLSELLEKAGRRNSKSDADKLEQAITLIRDVLGQLEEAEEPEAVEDEPEANAEPAEELTESNPMKAKLLDIINNMH